MASGKKQGRLTAFGFECASQPKLPKCDGRSGIDATETSVHGQSDCLSASSFGAIDVADYYQQRGQSDEEKYRVLVNAFRPESNYHFPSQEEYGKSRAFQSAWLELYSWLSYSPLLNGGFCVRCVLFSQSEQSRGQLTTSAMRNFTRACQTLKEHACQISHTSSMESAAVFMDQMEGRALPVHSQAVTGRAKKISGNRRKISSIVKTIIFCGRQNIALRGHREKVTEAMSAGGPMCNSGNFISLLRFNSEVIVLLVCFSVLCVDVVV